MNEIVYLNGLFIPKEEAKISPDDRGFNFADGIYEVVKYYSGKPFMWEEHLRRLERSLNETGIAFNETGNLQEIASELLNMNGLSEKNAGLYLQITRGSHKRVHHFPENLQPTVYATAFEMNSFINKLREGIKVISHEDIRWLRCDIKSVSLLPNTMLYNKAVLQGADECILIRNGSVTEATHSSVFGIRNGSLVTHPLSNLILPGITRIAIMDICSKNHIPVNETPIGVNEVLNLDELFISGTGSEIMPVVRVDESTLGEGIPGPVTRIIQRSFFERTYRALGNENCWWDWD